MDGGRSPVKASLLAQRLAAIAKGMRKADERRAWGEALTKINQHCCWLARKSFENPGKPR